MLYHISNYRRIDTNNFWLFFQFLNTSLTINQQFCFTFAEANQVYRTELNLHCTFNWFFIKNQLLKEKNTKFFNFNENETVSEVNKQIYFGHHQPKNLLNFQFLFPIKMFCEQNDFFYNIFGTQQKLNSKFTETKHQTITSYLMYFFQKRLEKQNFLIDSKRSKQLLYQSLILKPSLVFFHKKYKNFLTQQPFLQTNSLNTNIITQNSVILNKAITLFFLKTNF